jgi:hypothetical protein
MHARTHARTLARTQASRQAGGQAGGRGYDEESLLGKGIGRKQRKCNIIEGPSSRSYKLIYFRKVKCRNTH